MKRKTATTRYDTAEHLRTPEEMAAYLEACLERPTATRHSRCSCGSGGSGGSLVVDAARRVPRASVEGESRRELTVGVDLRLQVRELPALQPAMASAPAMNRRGGGVWLAMVKSACASFAGSPDCLPFCDFQYSTSGPLRSS